MTQPTWGWTAEDACTICVKSSLPPGMRLDYVYWASSLAGSAPHKRGHVKSNPDPTTHTPVT